jgi:putative oxidoreductase
MADPPAHAGGTDLTTQLEGSSPRLTGANGFIVAHVPPKPNRKVTVMLRRLISTSSTWITVPLRLALGVIFIGHGVQKVFGTFNGPGWAKWTAMSQAVPFPFMRPTSLWLGAAAVSELVGGVLILLGFLTRVGAFLIICTMLTAIRLLWPAFFAPPGIELPIALLGGALALLIGGGGQASVDRMLSGRRR